VTPEEREAVRKARIDARYLERNPTGKLHLNNICRFYDLRESRIEKMPTPIVNCLGLGQIYYDGAGVRELISTIRHNLDTERSISHLLNHDGFVDNDGGD